MNATDPLEMEIETLPVPPHPIFIPERQTNSDLATLSEVLRALPPIPPGALFLGFANDGLPVMLNLTDPIPGPVLISGDPQSGKTRLLKIIARFVEQNRDPESIRYTVITNSAVEWEFLNQSSSCEGLLRFHDSWTANYLNSLVNWAHSSKQDHCFLLLLVDGLEDLAGDEGLQQAFRWLLLRGPSRHIWPILTLNALNADAVEPWLHLFRSRLFGRMECQPGVRRTKLLTGSSEISFNDLPAGAQFAMRLGGNWLPFWVPILD